MSSPEVQRLQDAVIFMSATGRTVNTRNGQKTVWDCKTQDGRTFQSWDQALAQQAQNLVGQQVQVVYKETPSRDPQYPPNLQLETITPMGLQGPGAAAAPMMAQPVQQAAPMQAQPVQAAAPLPASAGTPGAGTSSGPSAEDKASMRRSAAVKAAAYLAASAPSDDPELFFWKLAEQILVYIETGNDPFPSDGQPGSPAGQVAPNEFPPGF